MNQSLKAIVLSSFLALQGCGGGGGNESVSSTSNFNVELKTNNTVLSNFTRFDNSFSSENKFFSYAYNNQIVQDRIIRSYAIDLNNDNKDELIIIVGIRPIDTSIRSISKVYVYQLDHNNKFNDVTTNFIYGNTVLEGFVTVSNFKKINNIVYGLLSDNEDRPPYWSGNLYYFAKNADNKYVINELGVKGSSNSPEIFIDQNQSIVLAAAGVSNTNAFYTNYVNVSNQFPYLGSSGFKFYSTNNDKVDTIIQISNNNLFEIEAYKYENNNWILKDIIKPFPYAGTSKFINPLNEILNVEVLNYNNNYMLGNQSALSMTTICNIKNNNRNGVLVGIPVHIIGNYTSGTTLSYTMAGSDYQSRHFKIAYTYLNNNKLVIEYPKIENEVSAINSERFLCKDFNNDGIEDILFYPNVNRSEQNLEVSPIIYFGKQDGSYSKSKFTPVTLLNSEINRMNQITSVLGDFNGDGYHDFVVYSNDIGYGLLPNLEKTFLLYKGNRMLE